MAEYKFKDIKYIIDEPVLSDDEDFLNHTTISDSILEALKKWESEKSSFTIGLFGGWGTGKSGIGKLLIQKIEKNPKLSIKVVEFDIWKYDCDSFRRQFLLFLNGKKGLDTKLKELERFYKTVSSEKEDGLEFNKESIARIVVALVIIGGIFYLLKLAGLGFSASFTISGLFAINFKIVKDLVLALVPEEAKRIIKSKKRTEIEERIQYPEQFEVLFDSILETSKEEAKYQKLVVIIDNLDRVSEEKVVELLSGIKTFLERIGVCFVIQCDEEAIKKHIQKIYKYGDQEENSKESRSYTDEFLRKFFNTYFIIPPSFPEDIDTYTKRILEKSTAPFVADPSLIATIGSAYRDNPRKIKQLINILVSFYFMAQKREEAKLLDKGVITRNPAMLAKVVLIQKEYKELFNFLVKNPHRWLEIDTYVKSNREIVSEIEPVANIENLVGEAFNFLKATSYVSTSDIKPFLFFKTLENRLDIPFLADINIALLDANQEKFKELISEVTQDNIYNYQGSFRTLLSENEGNALRTFNILNTLLGSDLLELMDQPFIEFVNNIFCDKNKIPNIEGFNQETILYKLIPKTSPETKIRILTRYIDLLNTRSSNIVPDIHRLHKGLFEFLTQNHSILDQKLLSQIRNAIDTYGIRISIDIVDLILKDEKLKKELFSLNFLNNLIHSIDAQELNEPNLSGLERKIRLLIEVLNPDTNINSLFQQFTHIYNKNRKTQNVETVLQLNKNFLAFLKAFHFKITDTGDLRSLADLLARYAQQFGTDVQTSFIPILLIIRPFFGTAESEGTKQLIDDLLQNWFNTPQNMDINELKDLPEKSLQFILDQNGSKIDELIRSGNLDLLEIYKNFSSQDYFEGKLATFISPSNYMDILSYINKNMDTLNNKMRILNVMTREIERNIDINTKNEKYRILLAVEKLWTASNQDKEVKATRREIKRKLNSSK